MPPTYCSSCTVFQKAVIEVNEEGTRAAAVTTTFFAYSPTSCPDLSRRVDFVADHPFAYFIIEEGSDAVIFAGHVVDPSNGTGVVIPSPAPFQEYTTTKTKFDEGADDVNHSSNNVYGPTFCAYSPVSPVYDPFRSTYSPVSPVYQYNPSVYKPTSPAPYRPTPQVYANLPDGIGPYQPQEVEEMSSGGLPKATAAQAAWTREDELPLEKTD